MSEPTYTLILTESERALLARALGLFVTKLTNAPIFIEQPPKVTYLDESPSGGTQAARAVLSPAASGPTPQLPPAAAPTLAPVELRDRWARDRKGNELPFPEGVVTREVNLCKTEQKMPRKTTGKPYLKITWQSQERGFVDANCFDEKLWPWLIKQCGARTTLHLMKAGEYLNVVGVRA